MTDHTLSLLGFLGFVALLLALPVAALVALGLRRIRTLRERVVQAENALAVLRGELNTRTYKESKR